VTAQDAFVVDDVRLAGRKADGLDRAVPNALVAVLAVGLL
jgi:hypothetical protein